MCHVYTAAPSEARVGRPARGAGNCATGPDGAAAALSPRVAAPWAGAAPRVLLARFPVLLVLRCDVVIHPVVRAVSRHRQWLCRAVARWFLRHCDQCGSLRGGVFGRFGRVPSSVSQEEASSAKTDRAT
ncbi:hypothetical protein GCM10010243_16040 [Streptomyces matensis]|nr:hypothetical protein GCM10010243_16040 [Streptomyces matensis]